MGGAVSIADSAVVLPLGRPLSRSDLRRWDSPSAMSLAFTWFPSVITAPEDPTGAGESLKMSKITNAAWRPSYRGGISNHVAQRETRPYSCSF